MPRAYTVTFEAVAVTAAQDLVALFGEADTMARPTRAWVGATDTTLVTAQSISTRCRILPATVTAGSGGTTPTPQPFDPGDAAASITAHVNDTTKTTTSGTASIVGERGDHLYQGAEYNFRNPPVLGPGEAFVFELLSTVTGTVHLSGGVEFEEIGG